MEIDGEAMGRSETQHNLISESFVGFARNRRSFPAIQCLWLHEHNVVLAQENDRGVQ